MSRDVQSLLKRLAVLAVLITGAILVTAEQQGNTVFAVDYCGYCQPFHNGCLASCSDELAACISGGGQDCNFEYYHCVNECDANLTFCQAFCNTGGGGGGGPYPKGSCGGDCYEARGDCLFGDPPEWIEDCLNNGGTRHTCCNEVFYDCMAGCP